MKSILEIQQDLEREGFKLFKGEEHGKRFYARQFYRSESAEAFSVIEVKVYNQDVEEDEAPDWEDEQALRKVG